jgi:CRISPR-associated endonuclease Csn1
MKKVLGLDIGTNSIGAALIQLPDKFEDYGKEGRIEWMGSRIIPLDGDYLQKFESGAQAQTKAAARRQKRGARRLKHRYKLRRTRLLKVFKALGWLDENFRLDNPRKFKQAGNENGYSFKISDYLPFSEQTISEFEKELGIEGKKSKKKGSRKGGRSIVPEDWIVYFLRKKALTQEITVPELLRIIYMFNQRRGFKSSRKDLKNTKVLPYAEFNERKRAQDSGEEGIETQFVSITKIKSVTFKEEKKDKKGNVTNVYTIEAEDPRMESWEETRRKEPEWVGEEFTFLVTQKVDKNGKSTQNKPQMPKEDDWALCTTALSEKIQENNQHPGEYFYEQIKEAYKAKRTFKARQYPVYRWRYQKELEAIWKNQCELNPALNKLNKDTDTLTKLAQILYPTQAKHNMPKLAEFKSHDLLHIISNDIIYFQRELKSQKNSISECRYEKRKGIDGEMYGLKCIPRSSPLFQEFRIWQDIHNIRILKKEEKADGKTRIDADVSSQYLNESVKEKLFDLFNSKLPIYEQDILKTIQEANEKNDITVNKSNEKTSHRINLFSNRETLKGNETLARYRSLFKKAGFDGESVLFDKEKLMKLWHIDYSITSSDEEKSKKGIMSALGWAWNKESNKWEPNDNWKTFRIPEIVALSFTKQTEQKKEYGSYSACAIKKLLPIMRSGKYWNENDIPSSVKQRGEQIKERLDRIGHSIRRLNEIADDDVQKQILKSFIGKDNLTKGLNTYQAGYLIYDKHSERDIIAIKTVEELSVYIQKEIPNNSLRNPIVEQVVRESMFLVRDVRKQYGEINEIHIELGRDLKNNAAEREKISKGQKQNFEEKQRIKKLLYELMNTGFEQYVDEDETRSFEFENGNFKWNTKLEKDQHFEVNPNPESPADIDKFRVWRSLSRQSELEWGKKVKDEKIPTDQEVKKYALWLSQSCRSPYTGKIIPLSKLFDTNQYEIEHIIPRGKMKNDGFNNLVIAEWGVNKAKGNQLAANFISGCGGKCKYGDIEYKLFTYEEYDAYCKEAFKFQKSKRKNLLATEVPEDFVERQLNDTRYIGRKLSELLTPVAKDENGIIFTGGSITSELKKNWGLNNVWKEIIRPRFERLEKITGNQYIIHDKDEHGNPLFHFNVKENEGLDLKRIDHRHHALDALIIAATTREHIRYLNTLSAADTDEEIKNYKRTLVKGKMRDFKHPWIGFTKHAKDELEKTIVTFKINNKIVTRPKNRTAFWKVENEKAMKDFKEQKPNKKWMAVRKSMFKEPQGIVYMKEVYEEKNILKAIEIQIDRMLVQDTPGMKTKSYVYDQEARKIIKDLIDRTGISIQEKNALLNELKRHLKHIPLKDFSGKEYKSIKVATFEEYAAKRVTLDKSFDHKKIDKIPYSKIGKSILGKLLHEHLDSDEFKNEKGNPDPAKAFSNEGTEILAKKVGKPITKVTIVEMKDESSKFGKRYVEVDAGSNVYFVMYEDQETKEREGFQSIAVHKAIEKIVKGEPIAEAREGFDTIILSPGDLVYVPLAEERDKLTNGVLLDKAISWNDKQKISDRIYKVNDFSKGTLYFVPNRLSGIIIDREIHNSVGAKSEQTVIFHKSDDTTEEPVSIKKVCIKLETDRLGNVKPFRPI